VEAHYQARSPLDRESILPNFRPPSSGYGSRLTPTLIQAKAKREIRMANDNRELNPGNGTLQSGDISDEVVSQVGKAAIQILRLRQSVEANMATAQTDAERDSLNDELGVAAVQVIGEQGLTVDEYNEVIAAAQSDPDLEERVLVACRSL
jgi:hypothetical protein